MNNKAKVGDKFVAWFDVTGHCALEEGEAVRAEVILLAKKSYQEGKNKEIDTKIYIFGLPGQNDEVAVYTTLTGPGGGDPIRAEWVTAESLEELKEKMLEMRLPMGVVMLAKLEARLKVISLSEEKKEINH